ncbi:MAG TPA: hypothetical protein VK255_04330 [Patescibacteria group bacterium]|nr:hypothetical protein [Patescibacteria group bacterium]
MEKSKSKFYEHFRMGVELEGEFFYKLDNNPARLTQHNNYIEACRNCTSEDRVNIGCIDRGDMHSVCPLVKKLVDTARVMRLWEVGTDGSIRQKHKGSRMYEIRTKIIDNEEKEKGIIEEMGTICNKKGAFAYMNDTAGTHIHISTKENEAKGFNDYALFIFDTTEFEKFFLKRYIATFRSNKYYDRLENNYCLISKRVRRKNCEPDKKDIPKARKFNVTFLQKLNKQQNSGRYYWLNTVCLREGQGIEIRLFPYITTPKGLQKVIDFTQNTFIDYFLMKKTQADLKILTDFQVGARLKRFRPNALSPLNELVRSALGINHLRNFWFLRPESTYPTGDIQLIMANWYKENPKILIQSARDKDFIRDFMSGNIGSNCFSYARNSFNRYNKIWNTISGIDHENEQEEQRRQQESINRAVRMERDRLRSVRPPMNEDSIYIQSY